MIAAARDAAIHGAALASALQEVSLRLAHEALLSGAESCSKGATRCLRSAFALLAGEAGVDTDDGCGDRRFGDSLPGSHAHSVLDTLCYARAAFDGFYATLTTAFHEKSYLTAAALLDVAALWAVLRRHKHAHAEAAAAATLRHAAADPANPATTTVFQPSGEELALLQCASAHAKAAYGAPAASGDVSSALGYLSLVTIGQATRRAPRNIPAAAHLRGVEQLTGCPPTDVLVASWTAHLHRPAFYVALDRQRRMVVVSVRGTLQLGDYCTVLDAVPQPATICGVSGHVHGGFMAAARHLLGPVGAALQAAALACPGWPVLLTGHSLGGGVAAVLTMLLVEQRQQWELEQQWRQQQAAAGEFEEVPLGAGRGEQEQQQQQLMWRQLGALRCIGVGAAAAFCETLGMACKQHVTSVLYGADCLPMFSVLGARLLIEEVHAKSRAAAAVGSILRRTRITRRRRSSGGSSSSEDSSISGSDAASLARTASSASSAASSLSCELVCGAAGCRGMCADSASELAEADDLAAALASGAAAGPGSACGGSSGTSRLHRCSSAWSTASTASIAAFAADASCGGASDRGASLVPMFPAGRILWLLPPQASSSSTTGSCTAIGGGGGAAPAAGGASSGGGQPAAPQLVETDQSAFERFLFTTETATVHLPDFYIQAIDAVAAASPAVTHPLASLAVT